MENLGYIQEGQVPVPFGSNIPPSSSLCIEYSSQKSPFFPLLLHQSAPGHCFILLASSAGKAGFGFCFIPNSLLVLPISHGKTCELGEYLGKAAPGSLWIQHPSLRPWLNIQMHIPSLDFFPINPFVSRGRGRIVGETPPEVIFKPP